MLYQILRPEDPYWNCINWAQAIVCKKSGLFWDSLEGRKWKIRWSQEDFRCTKFKLDLDGHKVEKTLLPGYEGS